MARQGLDERLLARLQKMGAISQMQAAQAAELARGKGVHVGKALVLLGFVPEVRVQKVLARLSGLEFLHLENFTPRPEALERLDGATARRYQAVPLGLVERALVVAVYDPSDLLALDELKAITGCPVRAILATETAVKAALDTHYASAVGASSDRVPRFAFLEPPDPSPAAGSPAVAPPAPHDPEVDHDPSDPKPEDHKGKAATLSDVHQLETAMETTMHDRGTVLETESPAQQPSRGRGRPGAGEPISEAPTLLLEDDAREHHGARTPAGDSAEFYPGGATPGGFDIVLPGQEDAAAAASKEETSEKSVLEVLKNLLDDALSRRAEELDLSPPESRRCHPRLRKDAAWHPATPYALKYHEPMLAKLREIAGAADGTRLSEHRVVLQGRAGQVAVVALFSQTQRGPRCVLRFPENIPLLQRPLRVLGLSRELEKRLEDRMAGRGGGLLFLTTDRSRTTDQIYASLLLDQAGRGRSVVSLAWNVDRNLPGVTQLHCPTEEDVREGLRHVAMEAPELAGVASIPTAVILREVVAACAGGQAIIGALTTPDAEVGASLIDAAGLDAMALSRGVAAHLHATALPRLDPKHRRPVSRLPTNLPEWARDIPPEKLMEADTTADEGTEPPRRGIAWVVEARVPDGDRLKIVQGREESLRRLAEEGAIDVRDAGE